MSLAKHLCLCGSTFSCDIMQFYCLICRRDCTKYITFCNTRTQCFNTHRADLLSISLSSLKLHCNLFLELYIHYFIHRCKEWFYMMHHAVPRGTALCSATLWPPEVKSCTIIWCVVQREHIVEDLVIYLVLSASKDFLVCNLYRIRTFYCAFYKDILHFLNPNTTPKNKINNWTKWRIFTWYPGVRFMSSCVVNNSNSGGSRIFK